MFTVNAGLKASNYRVSGREKQNQRRAQPALPRQVLQKAVAKLVPLYL